MEALLGLYAAKPDSLFNVDEKTGTKTPRRVYNIAGIRMNGQAPQASDIAAAVMKKVGKEGIITYNPNPVLTTTVKPFGILDDSAARKNWQWKGAQYDLEKAIDDFGREVMKYPDRIKAIELY